MVLVSGPYQFSSKQSIKENRNTFLEEEKAIWGLQWIFQWSMSKALIDALQKFD